MHQDLEKVCAALDALETAVTAAWSSDATMTDAIGWFAPTINRHELALLAKSLSSDIRSSDSDAIPESIIQLVQDIPRRLGVAQAHIVPQLYGGNAGQAVPAYISTISTLRSRVLPALGWQLIPDPKALPSNLARRARAASADLDQLTPNIAKLSKQIEDIQAAHAVVDKLFSSALDRLDEAPLRLVETSSNGIPWHELATSDAARRALKAAPKVKDKLTSLLRDAISSTKKSSGNVDTTPPSVQPT